MKRKLFRVTFLSLTGMALIGFVLAIAILFGFTADEFLPAAVSMLPWLMLALVVFALLAWLLADRITRYIVSPIGKINLTSPTEEAIYPELMPLVDRIKEQRHQLDIQVEELTMEHERQDSLRREFTANVSHELKTPLTSISGYAEIMQNGMVDAEHVSLFSGRIHSESRRLITLVEDIIKLSQLEGKEIPYSLAEIDLYDAASATLEHLGPVAEHHHISLHLEGQHCKIIGARQIIDEMINNLCDNAIKYNVPGGSVTVSISQNDKEIRLSVADTGIGIPADSIDRVFERFYRMDKSHSKAVGGTGLGLSIVKHGAAYHNAQIICTSTVNVGTTITIVFPVSQALS